MAASILPEYGSDPPRKKPTNFPGCICDGWAHPYCPGHTRDGLRGIHSCSRPATNTPESKEHAKNVLRLLRPNESEERIEELTARKTPWRAAATFYWQGLVEQDNSNYAKKYLPTATPGTGCPETHFVPSTPRISLVAKALATLRTGLQIGTRVAVRDAGRPGKLELRAIRKLSRTVSEAKVASLLCDVELDGGSVRRDVDSTTIVLNLSLLVDTPAAGVKRDRPENGPSQPMLPPPLPPRRPSTYKYRSSSTAAAPSAANPVYASSHSQSSAEDHHLLKQIFQYLELKLVEQHQQLETERERRKELVSQLPLAS
mmetsp:Transcript_57931/g.125824  ORF Transcript_57931/g.125824 Transcript_57931/m.125824 type:complete len:315 (+) Transcript_57931:132-1076(+)|eukprot:6176048-Pleurochrysis_carterae.AAC.2